MTDLTEKLLPAKEEPPKKKVTKNEFYTQTIALILGQMIFLAGACWVSIVTPQVKDFLLENPWAPAVSFACGIACIIAAFNNSFMRNSKINFFFFTVFMADAVSYPAVFFDRDPVFVVAFMLVVLLAGCLLAATMLADYGYPTLVIVISSIFYFSAVYVLLITHAYGMCAGTVFIFSTADLLLVYIITIGLHMMNKLSVAATTECVFASMAIYAEMIPMLFKWLVSKD